MKKNKLHVLIALFIASLVSLLFTSCFDPIYSVINTDVKPEKATVSGDITSIARYNAGGSEFLVTAASGGLRYKPTNHNTHGNWNTYDNLPFEIVHYDFGSGNYKGEHILKVVADKDYLYLVTAKHHIDSAVPHSTSLWAAKINKDWTTPAKEWKNLSADNTFKFKLPIEHEGRLAKSAFNIFYTNDPNPAYRKAYVRIGHPDAKDDKLKTAKYYLLNGTDVAPSEVTPKATDKDQDKSQPVINSVVHFGDTEYFFNSPVSITNGTATTEATYIYYGNKNDLYYSTDPKVKFTKGLSAGAYIAALAVTKDSILLGCGNPLDYGSGGIRRTSLNNGVPNKDLEEFKTNAAYQMPPSYKIMCLLNETPEKTELDSTLYATLTFPGIPASGNSKNGDKGLWSYYPERKNWNRE